MRQACDASLSLSLICLVSLTHPRAVPCCAV